MTIAALYLTILRIIHIFAAVSWVGGGIFMMSVINPTVQLAGPEGGRFMLQLAKYGRLVRVLSGAGVTTVVAGLLLYWPTSGGLNPAWLSSPRGITLTLGAIFGIITLGHGIFVSAPIGRQMGELATQILSRQGPPPPELMQQAQALGAKLGRNSMISTALGAIALL